MEEQGPFDQILHQEPKPERDRTALAIVVLSVALGIFLLILVLPPVSILDSDGGGASLPNNIATTLRDEMPAPPTGFEAVSGLYDLSVSAPVERAARLTVNLSTNVGPEEQLSLFTYQSNEWQRLGSATAAAGGEAASGDVSVLPSNVAVFRPSDAATARVVTGSLPPGGELDPRAQGTLSVLNPTGLAPSSDGQISGGPLELPQGLTIPIVPTIRASTVEDVDAVNAILTSPELRSAHVQAIADLVSGGNFAGIDIDYLFDPSLKAEFTTMAQALSTSLNADGKSLTITILTPVQAGADWDTGGWDVEALAPLVETFKIAPLPEQDSYYQRTEAALGFLTTRVGAGKLLLAVQALSRERSVEGVRALPLTEALGLANTPALETEGGVAPSASVQLVDQALSGVSAGPAWDDVAKAVTFAYTGGGGERTVWLANLFSETFRLDLASRFGLRGVAVEDVSLGTEDANVWPAVAQYAQTGSVQLVTPNGSLLQPLWTASGGTLTSDQGVQVSWTAPAEEGTYTLTLIVSDGIVRVGRELSVPIAGAAAP